MGLILKNTLKPHLKRTWRLGQLDSHFLAQMEQLLGLYELPCDPQYPVICYDERPCFLIGDRVEPIALQSGRPRKEHYALAQRFEFYYTPKSASWLNMIEIEFSALARLCLDRRIPTIAELETQVLAFFADRVERQLKIHWQFSIQPARIKLNSRYVAVNPDNQKLTVS